MGDRTRLWSFAAEITRSRRENEYSLRTTPPEPVQMYERGEQGAGTAFSSCIPCTRWHKGPAAFTPAVSTSKGGGANERRGGSDMHQRKCIRVHECARKASCLDVFSVTQTRRHEKLASTLLRSDRKSATRRARNAVHGVQGQKMVLPVNGSRGVAEWRRRDSASRNCGHGKPPATARGILPQQRLSVERIGQIARCLHAGQGKPAWTRKRRL